MNYEDFIKKYDSKRKSEAELIFFIKNRISKNLPNYSLLLGAGCSITSDVKSGAALVELWKNEYHNIFFSNESYDEGKLKKHFENECHWYNKDNEYSSLFEQIYHLPIQRRKFIQSQVDNKKPSIGYAYLVSLCEKDDRYFDTIYTTNFDDLINDSFYQFGHDRPVLCAHDSSVKSLSIHTNRPKIIKLHGDYLYDDIKVTNIETTQLEKNINSKFREFSKDFGLITIGYAGNDLSIMNAIEQLIEDKEEDYFSNGIYWCIRKGDVISSRLENIFNKSDKVFFVEIEGFDQLMATINKATRKNVSIFNKFNDSRREKIVNNLVSDKFNLCNSDIIKDDIASLKKQTTQKDIFEYITSINSGENINSDINDAEFKNLLQIDDLIINEKYQDAIDLSLMAIGGDISLGFKKKSLDRIINSYKILGNEYEASKYCDVLISLDEYESSYVVRKAHIYQDKNRTINILKDALNFFDNEPYFLNNIALSLLSVVKKDKKDILNNLNYIETILQKSIKINPSINNKVWDIYLDYIEIKIESEKDKMKIDSLKDKANNVLTSFKNNKNDIVYYQLKNHNIIKDETIKYSKDLIMSLIEIHKTSRISKKEKIENLICDILIPTYQCNHGDYKGLFSEMLKMDIFKNEESVHINYINFFYYVNVRPELNDGMKYLYLLTHDLKSKVYRNEIIDALCDIYKKPEMAIIYLESLHRKISVSDYYKLQSNIYVCENDYKNAIKALDKSFERGLNHNEYMVNKSFIFVKFEKYHEVILFTESKKDEMKIETESLDALIINEQFALKKLGRPIKEKKLHEIISKKKNKTCIISSVTICANIILNKNMQYKSHIIKNLEHYPGLRYSYEKWPIVPMSVLPKSVTQAA